MTATTTIAASTATGMSENASVQKISSGATTNALTAPASCVRAPADSMIDDRVTAPVTIIPWNTPADTFDSPSATSSSLASTR